MSLRGRVALALALVAIAWACYAVRRQVIGRFFVDGIAGAPPPLTADAGPGDGAAARVRVVLLDGLSRAHAAGLPELSRLCAGGRDLVVDVGFPTVSLPVQHVLWTGLTQGQSGVLYRTVRLDPPPGTALGARVAGSVAVGESHRDIVHSFGFAHVEPALARDEIEPVGSAWRTAEFVPTATAAVASSSPLVFVHVLRIDEAGHARGGDSDAYRRAAAEADAMLASWVAADPSPGRTRWFVLSDHGHRPGGGHGDAEDAIRLVRACIFGDVEPSAPTGAAVHLVDLHRAIAEALGLTPAAEAKGRTLAAALADPRPDATLPRPAALDVAIGALLATGGIVAAVVMLGRAVWLALAWPLLAWLGVVLGYGAITLSNPVVYPPLGADVLLGAVGGYAVLAVACARLLHTAAPARVIAALLLPTAAAWIATAWVCRVPSALVGGPPPLLPIVTAYSAVLATMLAGALATVALVVLATPSRPVVSARVP